MASSSVDEREKRILDRWDSEKTFEKSLEKTKDGPEYVFYDGPPFATGLPHYGHILASVIKDAVPRFWTMKGFHVQRRWGWDCHGLPIENIAEKELGIKSKDEIEKMGISKFNRFCREAVLRYTKEWGRVVRRIARWVDFENAYKTMDNEYIESVWWAFKKLYEMGYIYKGEKILMYCPRCSTPLSKSEIAMDNSYRTVKDLSVTVRFKVKGRDNTYFLAWTTTPWTLPSNLALAVNPNIDYIYVKDLSDSNVYILARDLVSKFYKNSEEYEVIKTEKGKDLEGIEYEPLFDYFKGHSGSFKVILGDFVTVEEGTGIVHTAPAFGEEDYEACKKYGISMVQPVDERGRFTSEVKDYAGEFVHNASERIVADLKRDGKVIFSRKIEHEYPFCYRCDTKLLYRALPAWFVDIQKIKKRLIEKNEEINWHPSFLKEGRVRYNIENAPDWNISRNRYWAAALPIWESNSGKRIIIGSIEELKKYAKNLPGEIDLHKDYLDKVVLEKDGEEYYRVGEVFDCWFESGSMTFAQFHYPFENKDYFEKHFPAQYVAEYIAQTRTWFYYMMVLSVILFDKIPFENVQTTGTILAEDGEKMSKSKGNFPDPMEVIKKYGADSLRFYLLSSPVMNAEDIFFSDRQVEEVYRKVLILIYNVFNFYNLYGDISPAEEDSSNVLDRWILSRVNALARDVGSHMEDYDTIRACSKIREFIDELSTWYVRSSRSRFNSNDGFAKKTLRDVLIKLSGVIAPIMPFVSEEIFYSIQKSSVHLSDWPDFDESKIDRELELEMNLAREITSRILRQRDEAGIGIRWPLQSARVKCFGSIREEIREIVKEEVNVKRMDFIASDVLEVELDTNLTPELEREGFLREIIRKIQDLRKRAGLVKKDLIEVGIRGELEGLVRNNISFIKDRTGAINVIVGGSIKEPSFFEEGKIKGRSFRISITKVN